MPRNAGSTPYSPGHTENSTRTSLKLEANTTVNDSYISDTVINQKLGSSQVQLTAAGNITVTSKVHINSSSGYTLWLQTSKDGQEYSGNIKIVNATIKVSGGVTVAAQGNITITNSLLNSTGALTVASGSNKKSITITNSNLSGSRTSVSATGGNLDITGGNVNGTDSVTIKSSATNGNATLSGVSVNTPDVNVTGSNITLDNTTLNVTPNVKTKGISIGAGWSPAKTVVIKNSTLNTTGSTAGVIKGKGLEQLVLRESSSFC